MAEGEKTDIPIAWIQTFSAKEFEGNEEERLNALNRFWNGIPKVATSFSSLGDACAWMYDHLCAFRPFYQLLKKCRGTAVSLQELADTIFPDAGKEGSLQAVSILLAIAPMARSKKGAVLFPARMHMLFRGIRGAYACANERCTHAQSDGNLTLGHVFPSDENLICPDCGSAVYELFNDRRCGALFFRGYILIRKNEGIPDKAYLWRYPGRILDTELKEILLFIPGKKDKSVRGNADHSVKPCYMDVKSGFLYFRDDSLAGRAGIWIEM